MDLRRRAVAGSAVTLLGQAVRFAVQSASLLVLSRILPVIAFGHFAMVFTITGAGVIIGDFGFSLASVQNRGVTQAQKSNLFWLNVVIAVCVMGALDGVAPYISNFYHDSSLSSLVYATTPTFVFVALGSQNRAELERELRFVRLAMTDVTAQLAGFLVALSIALISPSVWALVAQQLMIAMIGFCGVSLGTGWKPSWVARHQEMRGLVAYGLNTTAGQLVNYLAGMSDSVTVGHFDSSEALGIYSRTFQLFSLPLQQLAAPLTRVALPVLVEARATAHADFERYLARAQTVLSYLFIPIFTCMAVAPRGTIEIIFGERYLQGATILRLLALGGLFQACGYVYYWTFLAAGRMDVQFRLGLITRAVAVVLIVLSGPHGASWTAGAAAVGLLLNWSIYTSIGVRRAGVHAVRLFAVAMRPGAIAVLAATVSLVMGWSTGLGDSRWMIAFYVIAFAVCLVLAGSLSPGVSDDLRFLLGLIPRRSSGDDRSMPGRHRHIDRGRRREDVAGHM